MRILYAVIILILILTFIKWGEERHPCVYKRSKEKENYIKSM